MTNSILVIDNQQTTFNLIKDRFEREVDVHLAQSIGDALFYYADNSLFFSIVNASTIKEIRVDLLIDYLYKYKQTPIMVLSNDTDSDTVVKSIHKGAEQYLPLPVDEEILTAQVYAQLRRYKPPAPVEAEHQITVGSLKINLIGRAAFLNDKLVRLTKKEYDMLLYLVNNPRQVLSYEKIYTNVWGEYYFGKEDDKKVIVQMGNLTQKLMKTPLIENVRSVGYLFKEKPA